MSPVRAPGDRQQSGRSGAEVGAARPGRRDGEPAGAEREGVPLAGGVDEPDREPVAAQRVDEVEPERPGRVEDLGRDAGEAVPAAGDVPDPVALVPDLGAQAGGGAAGCGDHAAAEAVGGEGRQDGRGAEIGHAGVGHGDHARAGEVVVRADAGRLARCRPPAVPAGGARVHVGPVGPESDVVLARGEPGQVERAVGAHPGARRADDAGGGARGGGEDPHRADVVPVGDGDGAADRAGSGRLGCRRRGRGGAC